MSFSPDGMTLASPGAYISDPTAIKLWDVAAREQIATLENQWTNSGEIGHTDRVLSVSFSPDGTILASAAQDKTVQLWNVATREHIAIFSGHTATVTSVAFSPDGTMLASVSGDNKVKLWDTSEWAGTPVVNHAPTGAVTISGTAAVGETLTADASTVMDPDGPETLQFSYQWLASDVMIAGATSRTYTLTENETGKTIRVRASYIDGLGRPVNITSKATEVVSAPLASISDRTPQVQDAIIAAIPGVNSASDVTETHLAAIQSLYMINKNITVLKAGDFDGLSALTRLDLWNNDLTSLPAGIFNGLSALTQLWLFDNDLSSLPAGIFNGLSALTQLDLSGNQLSSLPDGVFNGLTALTGLGLSDNDLTSLPAGVFSGLSELTTLSLHDNAVTSLPLTVSLVKVGTDQFKAVASAGAPFAIVLPISVTNGSINGGATSVTIPAGTVESGTLTVTRTLGTTTAVTVDIGTLPGLPANHSGYTLVKSDDLPITVIEGDIADESVLTLTVGAGPGAALRGYNQHSAPEWDFGSFSPQSFELNGVSYTMYKLTYSVAGKRLALQTIPHLPGGFALHLDAQQFTSVTALDYNQYTWNNVELDWSDGKTVQIGFITTTPIPPGPPTNLQATPGYEKVTLSWIPPANADPIALPITEYEYRISVDGGNTWDPDWETIGLGRTGHNTLTSCTFGDRNNNRNVDNLIDINLTNGTTYTFEIRTRGGDGYSEAARITVVPDGSTPISERTPQVRDAIVAAVPGVNSAADVTEAHLAAITTLRVNAPPNQPVRPITFRIGDFSGLTTLTNLEMERWSGVSLPDGIFDGLNALERVSLYSSGLRSIPNSVLGLISLKSLNIGYHRITSIPAGAFDQLTQLNTLILDAAAYGNTFTSLPDGVFDKLTSLTRLNLDQNNITSLPDGVFDQLTSLESLSMSRIHSLSSLPADVFDQLTSLTSLSLQGLKPAFLPDGIFSSLSSLTFLDLSGGQLTSLPAGIFSGLSSLTSLYLRRNAVDPLPLTVSLEKVADGQFKAVAPAGVPFEMVLPLSVTDGSISGSATSIAIPTGSVESDVLTVTRTLGATAAVTVDIGTLPSLPTNHQGYELVKSTDLPLNYPLPEVRNVIGNRTQQVQDAIIAAIPGVNSAADVTEAHLAAITQLFLSNKGIASLKSGDFDGLTALTELYLNNNGLSSLPVGVFDGLTALTELYLSHSGLSSLSVGVFDGLTALSILDLWGNGLSSLPVGVFDGLTALSSINLLGNGLSSLPVGVFDGLTALTELSLNNNGLSSLPAGVFDGLTVLTTLSLGHNTVNPLPLTVSLQKVADGQFKAVAPAGAPFELVLPLTVTNGNINSGATSLTIPAGSAESDALTVIRTAGTTTAVTVDIGTLPSLPSGHTGYELVKSADLPLEVIGATAPQVTGINIPDANLRAKIESALGKTSGDPITAAEMATLTSLTAQDARITNVAGLETATNLTTLKLGNNTISNISALSGLTNLTELQLWDNQISNLSNLSGLTNLTTLFLWGNNISNISHLAGLTSLTRLRLDENSISNIAAVSSLRNLTYLSVKENAISDISAVSGLTNLTQLQIGNNTVSDITPVQNLTKLEWLDMPNNLEWLDMPNNSISDISAVQNLTQLVELYFQNNSVSNLSPLAANTGLGTDDELDVRGNLLSYPSIYTHIPALQARNVYIDFDNRVATAPVKISGDTQQSNTGATLTQPFIVEVRDGSSVVFAGVPVTFAVTAGGGTLSATNTTTDVNGRAETTLTLGNTAGTNTVRVSVTSITQTIAFTATATATPVVTVSPIINRTPQVHSAIVSALTGINSAADVTEAHLAAITELDLSEQGITTLQAGDFDGLTALATLNLRLNNLTELPLGIFDDLTAITSLDLGFNRFTTLPLGIFDNLTALTELTIDNGRLTALPSGIFDDLTALTSLNLLFNQFSTLPVGIFDKLTNLTELGLSGQRITLPAGVFDNLTLLTKLNLANNEFTTLPVGIFDKLTNLTELGLYSNRLTTLPAGIFDKLTNLTLLALNSNRLTTLPAGIFDKLTNLKWLFLSDNRFTTLPTGIFDNLTSLRDLRLFENRFITLPAGIFEGQTQLQILHLQGNAVVPLPLTISLKKVAEGQFKAVAPTGAPFNVVLPLSVTNGSISGGATTLTIPAGKVESAALTVTRTVGTTAAITVNIGDPLPGLPSNHAGYALVKSDDLPLEFPAEFGETVLSPVSNRTPQVRATIVAVVRGVNTPKDVTEAHLATITSLDLSNKNITTLKAEDFDGLSALQELRLNGNQLKTLPANVFSSLSSLEALFLNQNQLINLPPEAFSGLTAVTNLYLNNNQLETLPQNLFSGMSSLRQINIHTNRLTSLPAGVFSGLSSLTQLFLRNNKLTTLHQDVFSGLSKLQYLYLDGNQLTSLSAGVFSGLSSLTQLLLNNNRLSILPAGVFRELTGLTMLRLQANSVAPMPLIVSLEKVGVNKFKATMPAGAPFSIVLPLRITNGNISGGVNTLTIPQGSIESGTLTVTRPPGSTAAVTVDIGSPLPRLPQKHRGYELTKSANLPLEIFTAPGNSAPVFTEDANTTRTIAENTASGVNIGGTVSATDADNDALTYTLGGTDTAAFEIDSATGQLKTKSALDYETKRLYNVTVTVSDGKLTNTISVSIAVTDVVELATAAEVCQVGDVLAPGESCTYPGTDTEFSVSDNGSGQFLFFNSGNRLSLRNTEINGKSYTLVAGKLASGSWEIEEIADGGTQQPDTREQSDEPGLTARFDAQPASHDGSRFTLELHLSEEIEISYKTVRDAVLDVTGGAVQGARRLKQGSNLGWQITIKPDSKAEVSIVLLPTTDCEAVGAVCTVDGRGLSNKLEVVVPGPEETEDPINVGGTPTLSLSTAAPLTEATLHESIVTLTLNGGTYDPSIFTIKRALTVSWIGGVTVGTSGGDRVSDTQVTVELRFDGNLDTDGMLTFSVGAGAITGYDGAALTAQIPVPAVSESIVASTAAPLTEATLDESIVTLTLNGRKYEGANSKVRGAMSVSGIQGVTVQSFDIDRVNDTEVSVELTFNGDLSTDGTLTLTVGVDAIAGYNGPALTAQVPVAASIETPAADDETTPVVDETTPVTDGTSPGVCKVGNVLAPGESCTYPGTDTEFSVNHNGLGQFLFFSSGNRLSIENSEINGESYTLVAEKLTSGSWEIKEIADSGAQQPDTPEQPEQPGDTRPQRSAPPPTVTPGETHTSAKVSFKDFLYKYDENAYQVQLRRKVPQGEWITKCAVVGNSVVGDPRSKLPVVGFFFFPGSSAGTFVINFSFTGLEPDTTYEARYRDTNLSECVENPPSPDPWSEIAEGTTLLVTPPRVEFADATLATAVREALHLDTAGEHIELLKVPQSKLASLTEFDYSREEVGDRYKHFRGEKIVNLTGLEHATRLMKLRLGGNEISDITPLAQLTQLTTLDLGDDKTDDSSSLFEGTVNDPGGNQIRDITPLAQLTRLTTLDLGRNEIINIAPLAKLTKIEELYLQRNQIADIASLQGLTNLRILNLYGNRISDVSILTGLVNLQSLNLIENPVKDQQPLLTLLKQNPNVKIYLEEDSKPLSLTPGETPTLTVSTAAPLTEATLHAAIVTFILSSGTYEPSGFTIKNTITVSGITGVAIDTFGVERVSDTQVTVKLEFDGTLDTDGTLTFSVGAGAVAHYDGAAFTAQIPVTAVTESIVASTAAPLTEATLDESIVTLTLSGRNFEVSNSKIRRAMSVSGIQGVTVRSFDIHRVSDTEVSVELTFDGDLSTDGTLTFTVGTDAIAGYNAPALTAQVSVSASIEAPDDEDESTPVTDKTTPAIGETSPGVCQVGNVLAPGESCTYPGTDTEFSVSDNGSGQFLFFTGGDRLSLKNTEINGESYTLVAKKLASGSWEIEEIADSAAQKPDAPEQSEQPGDKGPPQQPVKTGGTPTLTASTTSPLTEAALHGSIVTLTLSGGTYARSIRDIKNAVSVSGITGVTIPRTQPKRKSDTQITIELGFNGNLNADSTLTFTVGAGAIVDYTGPAPTKGIRVTANTESVVASSAAPLTEETLHESVVTLTLSGATYEKSSFKIRGEVGVIGINGVTVATFGVERISDTQATIELEFDGTDFDTTSSLTFTVEAEALAGYNGPALTTQLSVTALTESVAATTPVPLTEATLDESVVTLTLNGRKYEQSGFRIKGALSVSGIQGVTIGTFGVNRVNDTQITVELAFNGNFDTDSTLTFTVGKEAIADYTGPALTAQLPVTADREDALLVNFPNPFNPETWIPYQLAKPAEVTITIYAVSGHVVRQLVLGHQAAGIYRNRSRAAYWDGKNEFSEPVASGLYFYTLTAGNFTATRKMLIQK